MECVRGHGGIGTLSNGLLSFIVALFTKVGSRLMIVYCLGGESAIVSTYYSESRYADGFSR